MQPIFQEFSLRIFEFSEDFFDSLLEKHYLPSCRTLLSDEEMIEFEENVRGEDFKAFARSLHKVVLHIALSEPPLQLDLVSIEERLMRQKHTEKFEYHSFRKGDFYCVDGFPKENLPCVVVFPPPMRGNFVY